MKATLTFLKSSIRKNEIDAFCSFDEAMEYWPFIPPQLIVSAAYCSITEQEVKRYMIVEGIIRNRNETFRRNKGGRSTLVEKWEASEKKIYGKLMQRKKEKSEAKGAQASS